MPLLTMPLVTLLSRAPCRRDPSAVPALAHIQSVLGTPATVFGWGLGRFVGRPHERLPLEEYQQGREAWARLLLRLGEPDVAGRLIMAGAAAEAGQACKGGAAAAAGQQACEGGAEVGRAREGG